MVLETTKLHILYQFGWPWLLFKVIEVLESEMFCTNYVKVSDQVKWNLVYCWDLSVWWTSYSFDLIHSIIKGENPTCVISYEKTFDNGLYSDIYRLVSFKHGLMVKITKFCILISLWMTLTLIQGHSCMRTQTLWCPFSRKIRYWFGWNSLCCHNLFAQVIFKGKNSAEVILWNIHKIWFFVRTLVNRFV